MAANKLVSINQYAVSKTNDIKSRMVIKYSDVHGVLNRIAVHVKKDGVKPAGKLTIRESIEDVVLAQIPTVARRIMHNQDKFDAHCAVWQYNAEHDYFELLITQAFLDAFSARMDETEVVPVFYSLYKREVVNDGLFLERQNVPVVTLVEAQPTTDGVVPFAQAWSRFWSDTDNSKPENTFFMLSCFQSPGPLIAHQLLVMAWFLLRTHHPIPWIVMSDDDIVGCRTLNGQFDAQKGAFVAPDCSKTLHSEMFLLEQLVEIRNAVQQKRIGCGPQIYAAARPSNARDIRAAKGNNPFSQTTRADSFLLISYQSAVSKIPFVNRAVMRLAVTKPDVLQRAFEDDTRIPWKDGKDEPMQRTLAFVLNQSEDYLLHLMTAYYTDGIIRTWAARGMILEKTEAKGNTRNLPVLDDYHVNEIIAIDRLTALTFDPFETLCPDVAAEDQPDG